MAKRKVAAKMKIRKVLVRVTMGVNGVLKTYECVWGGSMSVGTMFQIGNEWAMVQSVVNSTRGTQVVFAAMQGDPVAGFGSQWKRDLTNGSDTAAYINGLAALMMKKMEWKAIEQVKRCQDAANDAARSNNEARMARDAVEVLAVRFGLRERVENPRKFVTLRVPAEMVESED